MGVGGGGGRRPSAFSRSPYIHPVLHRMHPPRMFPLLLFPEEKGRAWCVVLCTCTGGTTSPRAQCIILRLLLPFPLLALFGQRGEEDGWWSFCMEGEGPGAGEGEGRGAKDHQAAQAWGERRRQFSPFITRRRRHSSMRRKIRYCRPLLQLERRGPSCTVYTHSYSISCFLWEVQ